MDVMKHADGNLITILMQDQMGGLQVLHDNKWVNVHPLHGALAGNIGDLLLLLTNDKFISVLSSSLITGIFMNYTISECTSKVVKQNKYTELDWCTLESHGIGFTM